MLECAPGDAEALAGAQHDLGRRLACRVNARAEDTTHVSIKLSSFQRLAGMLVSDPASDDLLLVPVGAASDGVHYLNLAAAGGVLIAGEPHETRQMVSAWTATLAATHAPEELTLLVSSELRNKNDGGLTQAGDGGDEPVRWLSTELNETLVAREAGANPGKAMPVVAFVGLPETWTADFLNVETLLHHDPEHRIYIVSIADTAEAVHAAVPAFGARVVFAGAPGIEGEEAPPVTVEAGGLMLTIGHRPPVVLQPIVVRKQTLPAMTPVTDHELEKRWGNEAWPNSIAPETPALEGEPTEEETWENGGRSKMERRRRKK